MHGHVHFSSLKLPRETRALVTLGPKVTKDRLLQGCMRMRKLGHGQSVIFAAPPEIDTQIRNARPSSIEPNAPIRALDVLRWAMLETCKDLQHHVSHWAQQGIEYARRHEAEKEYETTRDISVLRDGWTTPEARSLENMYGVMSPEASHKRASFIRRASEVPELRKCLEDLGVKELQDPGMDEEQEREVDHEVERQAETQRPPKAQPTNPSIHPGVENFIRTGDVDAAQSGLIPLFHPLHASSPELSDSWSHLLFASADFLQTVDGSPTDHLSEYMRPVNWIVSAPGGVRVVLSPHEVNEFLPIIRESSVVRLHVYAPRVSLSMLSFSDLRFFTIPPSPKGYLRLSGLSPAQVQLDLFAGQLYLSGYKEYRLLCAVLGLFIPSGNEDLDIEVETDGFMKPRNRYKLVRRRPEYSLCKFAETPIPALKDLVGLRRKGMKYLLTHVGKILHSRSLTPEDFQEAVV